MPDIDFNAAIAGLGAQPAVRIANAARPPEDYLFAQFLPERPDLSYVASDVNMIIRTTMAGLVGMDSPYPQSGLVEESVFNETTAKLANEVTIPEAAMRKIQELVLHLRAEGKNTTAFIQQEILNFYDKLVLQAHLDAAELLRGQALVTGALSWTFNKKTLAVSYGVPSGNFLPPRTGSDAYGGTTSKFWDDVLQLMSVLRYNVRTIGGLPMFVVHPDTFYVIANNTANGTRVMGMNGNTMTITRVVGGTEQKTQDARETINLVTYDKEGEIFDPVNPGRTLTIPFMPRGKVLGVANNARANYFVGEGSTPDPLNDMAVGFTHLGPTVEGGGQKGRWGRVYTPESRPYQLVGQGVSNIMPVIEVPKKIAVATTAMP